MAERQTVAELEAPEVRSAEASCVCPACGWRGGLLAVAVCPRCTSKDVQRVDASNARLRLQLARASLQLEALAELLAQRATTSRGFLGRRDAAERARRIAKDCRTALRTG